MAQTYEEKKAQQRIYQQSEHGKETRRKYQRTEKFRAYTKEYRKTHKRKRYPPNKVKRAARVNERYKTEPAFRKKVLAARAVYRKKYPEKVKAQIKTSYAKLRMEVLERYGKSRCACCGENIEAFLSIDHVNGRGKEHRKTYSTGFYNWLKNTHWPSGFQVLCFNCNRAKHTRGECPHITMKRGGSVTPAPDHITQKFPAAPTS